MSDFESSRRDLSLRLARIEGQLRGIQKLLNEGSEMDDCEKVAQQMAAARKALDKAFFMMLGCALEQKGAAAKSAKEINASFKTIGDLLTKYA